MSSPLSIFRRHQKALLAIFGVVIMITFVVGGVVTQYQSGHNLQGQAALNPVRVTWVHGQIRASELEQLRSNRQFTLAYLAAIFRLALERNSFPDLMGTKLESLIYRASQGDYRFALDDQELMELLVLNQKAKEMGLVVNDDAIKDFLIKLGGSQVGGKDLENIYNDGLDERISQDQLWEQLRLELMANNVRQLVFSGLAEASPDQLWEYFNRVYHRVNAEILPLEVASFVDQVEQQPTDAEVKAFYDRYKDQFSQPDSPEPGFKVRRQIQFQYAKIDFNKLLEEERAKITDEEVKAQYEKNKQLYRKRPAETTSPGPTFTQPATPGATTPSNQSPPATTDTPDAPGDPKSPASGDTGAPSDPPASGSPEPAQGANPPDPSAPAPDQPAADPDNQLDQPQPTADGSTDPNSSTEPPTTVQPGTDHNSSINGPEYFVAIGGQTASTGGQQPPPAEVGDDPVNEPDQANPQADQNPVKDVDKDADKNTGQDADTVADQDADQDRQNDADQDNDKDKDKDKDDVETDADKDDAAAGAEEYTPLEEVADGIRTELAKPKAQARLDDIKKQVVDSLTRFNRRYTRWEMAAQDEARDEEPQFKLDDLAQSLGFEVGQTPLVDRLSVKDHELGKAEVGGFQFVPLTFDQMAFDEDLPPYNARTARATDGAEFVYWRTKVQEAYVPPLSDIRPDVVYAWKFQRARELARAKAKELASQANKAQKLAVQASEAQASPEDVVRTPLKQVFAGDADIAARLFETGDFSWLTRGVNPFGMGGAELEISAVNGVEQAGEEFMRKVFSLDLGEVGVAENLPETFVYVVRIDSSAPSLDIRRQIFLNAGLSDVVSSIINRNQGKLQNEWLADVNQQLKVTWVSQDEPSQDSSL